MLSQLTPRQVDEWIAYNNLEPIGELRGDFRIARLCLLVCAAMGAKNVRMEEFMPFLNPQNRQQSREDVAMRFKMWIAAHNANVARKNKGAAK